MMTFTPSTSKWAQNVVNIEPRHSKMKSIFYFNIFKWFLILVGFGKLGNLAKLGRKLGKIGKFASSAWI